MSLEDKFILTTRARRTRIRKGLLHKEKENMLKSVEAIIEKNGEVHLQKPIHLRTRCRAILTILDEKSGVIAETALLSEVVLSEDWNRPEEEEAWSHLQNVQ